MSQLRFLVISPDEGEQSAFKMLLGAIFGSVTCLSVATLEEASLRVGVWQPDVVLIAIDLAAIGETRFRDCLQALQIEERSLVVADMKPWNEWHWAAMADQVLLKGFSFGDLRSKVDRLLATIAPAGTAENSGASPGLSNQRPPGKLDPSTQALQTSGGVLGNPSG